MAPGRNQLEAIRRGKARRLNKKGQVFNRIHVEDIAQTLLEASMDRTRMLGYLFNISDDEPAPAARRRFGYACELLGIEPPPEVSNSKRLSCSPMARSFYGECKRVRNTAHQGDSWASRSNIQAIARACALYLSNCRSAFYSLTAVLSVGINGCKSVPCKGVCY